MSIKYKEVKRCTKLFDGLFVHIIKFALLRERFEKKGLKKEWNEAVDMCARRYAKAFGVNVDDVREVLDEVKL